MSNPLNQSDAMEKLVKILEKVAWVAAVVVNFVKALVSPQGAGGDDSDSGK